jgi:hypothetical protein
MTTRIDEENKIQFCVVITPYADRLSSLQWPF